MAASIDLGGLDPWGTIGAAGGSSGGSSGGSAALDMLSGAAGLAVPGLGWAQLGMQVLGGLMSGDSTQSGAASGAELNTSGWVVGDGEAAGGDLSASRGFNIPWWGWAGGALLAAFILKKAYQ